MRKEIFSEYFNLLKTIVGSGIVAFPSLFPTFGIFPTVFFAVVAAFFSSAGLWLLSECALFLGTRETTFSASLAGVLPQISGVFNLVVFLKCFGVSVSYLVVVRSLLEQILKDVNLDTPGMTTHLVVLYGLLMAPVCTIRDLKALKWTSLIGICGAYFCLYGGVHNLVAKYAAQGFKGLPEAQMFRRPTWYWAGKTGQLLFLFTCHQNIFAIRAGMANPSRRRMVLVIGSSVGSALVLYILFGIVSYLTYGEKITDNVLNSFPSTKLTKTILVFYTVLLSCSYPLQVHPARDCLSEWISGASVVIMRGWRPKKTGIPLRILSTTVVVVSGVALALSDMNLRTIQSLVGGTASAVMCNVIPAASILSLERKKSTLEITLSVLLLSYALLAFSGVIITVRSYISDKPHR